MSEIKYEDSMNFDEWVKELVDEFRRWKHGDESIAANVAHQREFWKREFYHEGYSPKQAYYEWGTESW